MSQPARSVVPKFGSFKPKTSAAVSEEKRTRGDRTPGNSRSATHDSYRKDEDKDHKVHLHANRQKRHHEERRSLSRSGDGPGHHERRQRHSASEPSVNEPEESNLYFIDRRGDNKNLEYETLHRYSVPTHHRIGYGRLIGASDVRINRDESSDKFVVLDADGRRRVPAGRALGSKSHVALSERKLRLIAGTGATAKLDSLADFVPLRPLKRKLGAEAPDPIEECSHLVDYRSVDGKAEKDTSPEDVDLEYASESDEGQVVGQSEADVRSRNAALSRDTKDRPKDVEAWLDFIQYQAEIIKPGTEPNDLSSTERRSLADVRLSIYDQALKHIKKGDSGYDSLLVEMIEEGSLRWDNARLTSKWQQLLEDNPSSSMLWMAYLNFVQTNPSDFTYEKCKAAYVECLEFLRKTLFAANPADQHKIMHNQLYVFLRFTRFTRDSGYDELGNAMWQAVLEYHFNDSAQGTDTDARLHALAELWESEEPRIGADGAPESHDQIHDRDRVHQDKPSATPTSIEQKQPMLRFANAEADLLAKLHLSASSEDDVEDDPYRYVMFSDLQEVISHMQNVLQPQRLVDAFLVYMGLPLPSDGPDDVAGAWNIDQFLRTSNGSSPDEDAAKGDKLTCWTVGNFRLTTYALFTDMFTLSSRLSAADGKTDMGAASFVDRVLEHIVRRRPDNDAVAEYLVAFKLHFFPSVVSKFTKGLLKSRPSSLRLYNAFALVEARHKRFDKARSVWSAAMSLDQDSDDGTNDGKILLWHSWMKSELAQGNDADALRCLLAMSEDAKTFDWVTVDLTVTSAQKLRFVSYIRSRIGAAADTQQWANAAMYAECHMYFAYITQDWSIDAALQVCTALLAAHDMSAVASELLHQAKVELLRFHVDRKRPYKAAQIRAELLQGIKLFPDNSSSFDLLDHIDAHYPITDRIREVISAQADSRQKATIVSWSHAITREIQRYQKLEISGSTQHSVRRMFTRALPEPSSAVKHSQLLWKMWFEFERSLIGEQAHQRVRQVFLDGLRLLPWSKTWVILGLQYLANDGHTPDADLRQIYDVLVERDLRIRIDLG